MQINNRTSKKAINKKKGEVIDLSDDSASFFNQQIRREKALSKKLKLKEDIQERLQSRHTVFAISQFLSEHAEIIRHQHFLYEVNGLSTPTLGATIRFQWLPNVDNRVYTLDSQNYCLFTREEYTTATTIGGVSKGMSTHFLCIIICFCCIDFSLDSFYNIRRRQSKDSAHRQSSLNQQKKKKQQQPTIIYKGMSLSLSLSLSLSPCVCD